MIYTLEEIKQKATPILLENGVIMAGITGSYAKGLATEESDIDLLIDFGDAERNFYERETLKEVLETHLEKHVDLIIYHLINDFFKVSILGYEIRWIENGQVIE